MAVNTINQKLVNNVSYECSVSHGLKKYISGGSSSASASSFPHQEVNPTHSAAGTPRFSPKPVRVPSHSDWEVRQFPAYNSRNGVQGDSRSFFSHSPPSSSSSMSANHSGLFGGRKIMTDFSSNSHSHSSSSAELSPMNSPRPVYPSLYPQQHQFPSSLLSTFSHSSSASSTSVSPFPEFSLSSGPTAAMMMMGTGMEVGMNSYYKEELPVSSSHELPSSLGLFF
jgi:hypothetical protein